MTTIGRPSLLSSGIQGIEEASKNLTRLFTKLASGKRINQASDDAAGLALSGSIENKLRTLEKATQNITYSTSALQTADSTAQQAQEITGRLAELATQASNSTYSTEQRAALQTEFNGLTAELQRLGEANGATTITINGSTAGSGDAPPSNISVGGLFYGEALSSVKAVDLSSAESSRAGLAAINTLSQNITQYRSDVIGATQSRLESAQAQLSQRQVAEAESLSRIRDLDIATATADTVQNQIRLQGSAQVFSSGHSLDATLIKSLLS